MISHALYIFHTLQNFPLYTPKFKHKVNIKESKVEEDITRSEKCLISRGNKI